MPQFTSSRAARNVVFIDRDRGYKKLMNGLKLLALRNHSAQVGWWPDTNERSFELALMHEFGNDHFPPRPILGNYFDQNRPRLGKRIAELVELEVKRKALTSNKGVSDAVTAALKVYGEELVNDVRMFVLRDYPANALEPNAESTVSQKGFDLPMFETGRMLRDLEYRVVRVGRPKKKRK